MLSVDPIHDTAIVEKHCKTKQNRHFDAPPKTANAVFTKPL